MVQGLAFLSKKSWHTKNLNNQEKVWIAEERKKAEAQKTKELQKQIQQELEQQELDAIAGRKTRDRGIDWMYDHGPSSEAAKQDAERRNEEYLLGKEFVPGGGAPKGDLDVDHEQEGVNKIVSSAATAAVAISSANQSSHHDDGEVEPSVKERNEAFRLRYEDPMFLVAQQAVQKERKLERKKQLLERVTGAVAVKETKGDFTQKKMEKERGRDDTRRKRKQRQRSPSSSSTESTERSLRSNRRTRSESPDGSKASAPRKRSRKHRRSRAREESNSDRRSSRRSRSRSRSPAPRGRNWRSDRRSRSEREEHDRQRTHRSRSRHRSRSPTHRESGPRQRSWSEERSTSPRVDRRPNQSRHHRGRDERSMYGEQKDTNQSPSYLEKDLSQSARYTRERSPSPRRYRDHKELRRRRSESPRTRDRNYPNRRRDLPVDRRKYEQADHVHVDRREMYDNRRPPPQSFGTAPDAPMRYGLQGAPLAWSSRPSHLGPDPELLKRKRDDKMERKRLQESTARRREMTPEERAKALREMESDARFHEQQRTNNLSRTSHDEKDNPVTPQTSAPSSAGFLHDIQRKTYGLEGISMQERLRQKRQTNQSARDSFL